MTSHNEELLTRAVAGVFILIATLFFINIFNLSYPIRVITSTTVNELAVVGEGKVEVVPDIAYVDVGITVDKVSTVIAAQDKLSNVNNALVAAMKKLGIDKKMIKTSNYSVNPNYSYKNEETKIDGYTGNATLSITVKDLELVSKVITAATAAGANQINGTRFDIENPSKHREQLLNRQMSRLLLYLNVPMLWILLGAALHQIYNQALIPLYRE